jgi:DNA-binding NarL/FixJ family response regulator
MLDWQVPATGSTMTTRVAVVDDDDVTRRGLVELLDDQPEIEVTGALSHVEALAWEQQWTEVDVAIVDACDERQVGDQFPGVEVVGRIRRFSGSHRTTIVVRTGQFFDDAVRRRMGEAHADYFFHRSELQDVKDLRDVVLHPERFRAGVPEVADPEVVLRFGVNRTSRVNDAVAMAFDGGPDGEAQQPAPSIRGRMRRRHQFNQVARLTPVNSDGTAPDRNQSDPSMPQITRFLEWATRSKDARP